METRSLATITPAILSPLSTQTGPGGLSGRRYLLAVGGGLEVVQVGGLLLGPGRLEGAALRRQPLQPQRHPVPEVVRLAQVTHDAPEAAAAARR